MQIYLNCVKHIYSHLCLRQFNDAQIALIFSAWFFFDHCNFKGLIRKFFHHFEAIFGLIAYNCGEIIILALLCGLVFNQLRRAELSYRLLNLHYCTIRSFAISDIVKYLVECLRQLSWFFDRRVVELNESWLVCRLTWLELCFNCLNIQNLLFYLWLQL